MVAAAFCVALCVIIFAVASAGCAKVPDTGAGNGGTRLLFELTVSREINPNYIYIVALRPSTDANPTEQGPIPVIAPPWGNGFVAGHVSYFVQWATVQSPRYLIYKFRDTNLIDYFTTGAPVNYIDVDPGGRKLKFELDLTQIVPDPLQAANYQSIQVNFFTMDRIPQGNTGTKNWDAIGDGRLPGEVNTPLLIPLRTSGVYDNARYQNVEPLNDVADPDLDITDFRVEVSKR